MRAGMPASARLFAGGIDVGGVVVRLFAAAQNDVAVLVAGGRDDGGVSRLGDRQEMMRCLRGTDRVHGDAHVAVGAVLEADGAGETRSELAMHLALGGARADGAPRNQVGDVLRRDHVEKFRSRRACRIR